ncbi:hypothetical protein HanXRQr2_Chr16g0766301 [Helianthus annuus]|uniref:Uncharacterized protein n=1 Tax=Helianthus annuus TaxID=4232 RepID=A0A9K3DVJ9_HELAN|nr:hypothetical protein HanXRQr2_Chr16g0766301 [Helianthus annuus]KAJ0444449.1 hypothetical protein HanIR_Chr16g0831961 [Helianthus annuus]KAJ0461733.1 hypothetical protein HanHA89_Chr16g0675671 [Helianthus annuus]KAJ0642132.1 hypothetical protein HanLR1_Chr16g0634951 [Helianthus annuus]KAJ0646017.1 hypothetical protein HanOQP8_Chr16g0630481 [Helianthus annuus]
MPTLGKKTLRKHNVYGLTPSVAFANSILTLPEGKRQDIMAELEKLVSEWPLEVIKSRKDEGKMVLAAGLQEDIPAIIDNLSGLGVETNIKMDDLTKIPF